MVIVKASAIAQNQVAADGAGGQTALRILNEVIGFVMVLQQLLNPEAAGITMRILTAVIPAPAHSGSCGGSDEGNGFADYIQTLRAVTADPNFGFGAELNIESLLHG
jgi:hypothetical protein